MFFLISSLLLLLLERKENLKIFLRVCTTNFNLKLLYLIIVGGSDKEIRYDESKLTILEKRRKEERRGKNGGLSLRVSSILD